MKRCQELASFDNNEVRQFAAASVMRFESMEERHDI